MTSHTGVFSAEFVCEGGRSVVCHGHSSFIKGASKFISVILSLRKKYYGDMPILQALKVVCDGLGNFDFLFG